MSSRADIQQKTRELVEAQDLAARAFTALVTAKAAMSTAVAEARKDATDLASTIVESVSSKLDQDALAQIELVRAKAIQDESAARETRLAAKVAAQEAHDKAVADAEVERAKAVEAAEAAYDAAYGEATRELHELESAMSHHIAAVQSLYDHAKAHAQITWQEAENAALVKVKAATAVLHGAEQDVCRLQSELDALQSE